VFSVELFFVFEAISALPDVILFVDFLIAHFFSSKTINIFWRLLSYYNLYLFININTWCVIYI